MKHACRSAAGFAALTLFCLGVVPGFAQDTTFKAVKTVSPNIHTIMTGGFWNQGRQEGFFRAVVTAGEIGRASCRERV